MSNTNWVSVVQHVFAFFVFIAIASGIVSTYYSYRGEFQKAMLYLWAATVLSAIEIVILVTYTLIR